MSLADGIRRNAFWFYDFLRGGNVRKNYIEIASALKNGYNHNSEKLNSANLIRLLRHATSTTPFYSAFTEFRELGDFPVINKTIIRENLDGFLSTYFEKEKLHRVTTSGSTGAPFTVFQDAGKRYRHQAENIYFSEEAGYKPGSRLYYLRVWNSINRKSWLEKKLQNIIAEDISDLSEDVIKNLIDKISKDRSCKSVLAFSSTLEALSQFVIRQPEPLPVEVKSLIAMSESLPDGAKHILSKAFRCPVVSRYSNMENGFIAQQCIKENSEYHINTGSFHVELLRDDIDEPANEGDPGRIVITDLFNYGMPLIRYDTGDIAILSTRSGCGIPGPVFTRVEGRKVDFIHDTRGHPLSPHVITNTMWKYASEIQQFQFIQNGRDIYLLKLNCKGEKFSRLNELIKDYTHYLGKDAKIKIEFIDEVPVLSSGKRRKIVNNYHK